MEEFRSSEKTILSNKYLPHNFLAEKMVLSCLLFNPQLIRNVTKSLSVDAFYFKNHQEIYKALIFMDKNEISIDIITLLTFLQDNGLLDKIGGVPVLIEIVNQIPNINYLKEYIGLIKDKFIRRSLIRLSYEIINSSYITNISLETILTTFENKIFNLTNEIDSEKMFSSAEVANNIFLELKKKSLNPTLFGISSGFYDLDSLIQGFQKSDLIILAARPSVGKTALSLNIALNIVKNYKFPVLFFSLEMAKEQIMYRLLSIEGNIDQTRLKSGKLRENDWMKVNKVIKIIAKLPFFIDDTPNLSIADIRSKLKTVLFEQKEIGLVIIDYLQLMQDLKLKNENRVQELSKITRSLKILAREFNIPIIALSQLSRNIENRIDKRPILSDLRESGSIEQDADVILMLYKNSYDNLDDQQSSIIELIIAKQRNGPTGTVQLKFEEKQTKFLDINETNFKIE
jgi:replicative DNA helicase